MKTKWASRLAVLAVIGIAALALLLTASTPTLAGGTIAPINSHPNGATYGEWSVRWWQWAYRYPVHNPPYTGPIYNPLFIKEGDADCSLGQTGHVWFIGGILSLLDDLTPGAAERWCSIPSGTALFFPLVNAEFDNVAVSPPMTVDQIRAAVKSFMDSTTELHATIDGAPVPNLYTYRAQSPVFAYSFPYDDNIYKALGMEVPGPDTWPTTTVYPAVSDGYWLFVHPLPPGVHTLKFGGTTGSFATDVTYHITVTPGR